MGHRLVEHVGEVELALEAATEAGLYVEALEAFRELVAGDGPAAGPRASHRVVLGPAEPALLLVDWLNELVYLAEVEAFVPREATALELADGLQASVAGVRGEPRHLVKGATLHGLELHRDGRRWRARVVLDV